MNKKNLLVATFALLVASNGLQAATFPENVQAWAEKVKTRICTLWTKSSSAQKAMAVAAVVAAALGLDVARGAVKTSAYVLGRNVAHAQAKLAVASSVSLCKDKSEVEALKIKASDKGKYLKDKEDALKTAKEGLKEAGPTQKEQKQKELDKAKAELAVAEVQQAMLARLDVPANEEAFKETKRTFAERFETAQGELEAVTEAKRAAQEAGRIRAAVRASFTGSVMRKLPVVGSWLDSAPTPPATTAEKEAS
jgi:hypothetical protein